MTMITEDDWIRPTVAAVKFIGHYPLDDVRSLARGLAVAV